MDISSHKPSYDKIIDHFQTEIAGIKTGRANPVIVENIMVEAYGAMTPLLQLASISVPQPRTIVIQPWDKTVAQAIEKAIVNSNIGLSPVAESGVVRLNIPPLTEEDRANLVKLLKTKTEDARIAIRGLRDKIKNEIHSILKFEC